MPRRHITWLVLILALAFIIRLVNLGARNLWYDEAFAVLFSEKGLDAMVAGTLTPVAGGASDIHPLLYYTTLNLWMSLFGQSPFVVRLWSVLLGVLTVAVIYLIARDLFDTSTGLVAALITAIAPFHVQYSQETRMYALLGLLLALATWCFLKGWRQSNHEAGSFNLRTKSWWIAFGVCAALAMYTQQLAAFYLVALALIPLVARRWQQLFNVVLGAVIALLIYLPWLVNLPGQLQKVSAYYWLSPPNIAQPLLTVRSFLNVNLDIPAPASMIAFLGSLFVVIFLIVQIVLFWRGRRSRVDRKPVLFLIALASLPPALMWLVSQVQPVYLERSLLPSALMLYILLAWLLTRSGTPRFITTLVSGVGLLLVGIGLYYQYTWASFPNSPFASVGEFIRQNWRTGDVVIHQNKLTALPVIYHERDLDQRFLGDKPGSSDDTLALPTQQSLNILASQCVQQAARDAQRVWWVVYEFAADEYAAANRPELQQAVTWLSAHYTPAESQYFNDLEVVLYSDPQNIETPECSSS